MKKFLVGTVLAILPAMLAAVLASDLVRAENPFFVTGQPADVVVSEGDDATFAYDIDNTGVNQRPVYYTWLETDSRQLTNFNTNILVNCQPFNTMEAATGWTGSNNGVYSTDLANFDCRDDDIPAYWQTISVMVSAPFSVNGVDFTSNNYYPSSAVSGTGLLTYDYDMTMDGYIVANVVKYDAGFEQALQDYQTSGMLDDITSYGSVPSGYAEAPIDFWMRTPESTWDKQSVASGSSWMTIPENGTYVAIFVSYVSDRAEISNIQVNNVLGYLGDSDSLTITPSDASYHDGAQFRAISTVWPGADMPIDWLSQSATLKFKTVGGPSTSGPSPKIIIPAVPNTGRR
jgi:hypothetical protein